MYIYNLVKDFSINYFVFHLYLALFSSYAYFMKCLCVLEKILITIFYLIEEKMTKPKKKLL